MFGQRCTQHAGEMLGPGLAAGDRGIAPGLIDHQHRAGPFGVVGFAGMVVFGDARRTPRLAQRFGPCGFGRRGARRDQAFEARGVARIVVNTFVVPHQGQGRIVRPQPDGAQKPVFDAQHRQTASGRPSLGALRAGFLSPGQHRVGAMAPRGPRADESGFRQQCGQGRNLGHTLAMNHPARWGWRSAHPRVTGRWRRNGGCRTRACRSAVPCHRRRR